MIRSMRELRWLRERIWLAVALPLAGGCDRGAERRSTPPTVVAPVDAAADDWTIETNYNGCGPSWEKWCGTPAVASSAATGDALLNGCPTRIAFPPEGTETGEVDRHATMRGTCCYDRVGDGCAGRPLLDGDRAIVAAAPPARDAEAARWLAAALDEHASIASFARATLELLAVGAPPALIAGCQRAGLDEVRHAEACFARAGVEPGPLPALAPRGGGLAQVARDTFVEGCVGETIGAALAAKARDAATDPAERALWARIADDEARHAALAWQTVRWAISVEPQLAAVVRAAAEACRRDDVIWREVIAPAVEALCAT
jgi:hypothetical protein